MRELNRARKVEPRPLHSPVDRREHVRACAGFGRLYGSVLGGIVGLAIGLWALSAGAGFWSLLYPAVSVLFGAMFGPLCGRAASRLGRRMWSPFGWGLAGVLGMLMVPVTAFVPTLLFGGYQAAILVELDWWLFFGGLPVLLGGICGCIVGSQINRGHSRLPRVNELIRIINEAASAEPHRFGRAPGEVSPAVVPASFGEEVSPSAAPQV